MKDKKDGKDSKDDIMRQQLTTALLIFVILTLLTGLLYPLLVTGIAQVVFPRQANGSLIVRGGKAVGSELIGQAFSSPRYFWSRPSATTPSPYNAAASLGSNLGPTNPDLLKRVKGDVERIQAAHPGPHQENRPVPVDLVTTSGSGLDPHISPAAAFYQVERVAAARGLAPAAVRRLVEEHVEGRTFGVLGEPRVNVLELNLDLDGVPHPRPLSQLPPPIPGRGGKSKATRASFCFFLSPLSRGWGGGSWERGRG